MVQNFTLQDWFPEGKAFAAFNSNNRAFTGLAFTGSLIFFLDFFYWYFTEENIGQICETRGLFFQEPANGIMEGIIDFHHDLFFILIVIVIFVCFMLFRIVFWFGQFSLIQGMPEEKDIKLFPKNFNSYMPQTKYLNFHHNTFLEVVWTITPAILLIFIAIPSFILLYTINEVPGKPLIILKIIGRQWYWSYEYSLNSLIDVDFELIDQYLDFETGDSIGSEGQLYGDSVILLPKRALIQLLITSSDVIHSWAVPAFGIKVDACPGRLNQIFLTIDKGGLYYGQCSEICGTHHGFMPIMIRVVDYKDFLDDARS